MPKRKTIAGLKQFECATEPKRNKSDTEAFSDPLSKSITFQCSENQSGTSDLTRQTLRSNEAVPVKFSPPDYHWQVNACERMGLEVDITAVKYDLKGECIGHDFERRDVGPDGNCLFRCVSFMIAGNEDKHKEVRHALVEYMRKFVDKPILHAPELLRRHKIPVIETGPLNTVINAQNYGNYLALMKQDKIFGGDSEIIALASMLSTDIWVYTHKLVNGVLKGEWNRYGAEMLNEISCESEYSMYLWHRGAHYNVVLGARELTPCIDYPTRRNIALVDNERNLSMTVCTKCGKSFKNIRKHKCKNILDISTVDSRDLGSLPAGVSTSEQCQFNSNVTTTLTKCDGCHKSFRNINRRKCKSRTTNSAVSNGSVVDVSNATSLNEDCSTPKTTCSGCNKTFTRIRSHWSSNGKCPVALQTSDVASSEWSKNRKSAYNSKNKDRIRQKQAHYDGNKSEQIREKQARYNANHAEQIREKQTQYNKENRELIRDKQAQYNDENRELIRDKQAQYNDENRELIRDKHAQYNDEHRQLIRDKQAHYNDENRELIRDKHAQYNKENREEIRSKQAQYNKENREAINRKHAVSVQSKKAGFSSKDRLKKFRTATRYGPVFPCSCCHRMMYKTGVTEVTQAYKHDINSKFDGFYDDTVSEVAAFDHKVYLCKNCRVLIKKRRMPPMCVKNGLEIDAIPDELQLSDLESVLIAKNILFFKLFKLPKSRWSAIKDKVVNVPINDNDILRTISSISSLPRSPDSAGLIPIQLKRKAVYKNYVYETYVDPEKLMRAVEILKENGHPGYSEISLNENFKEQLKIYVDGLEDGASKNEKIENENSRSDICVDDSESHVQMFNITNDELNEHEEMDNIKKYQFRRAESYIMDNDCPEISVLQNNTNADERNTGTESYAVAPGEGKIPTNLMRDEHWDINAFPHLHPTGRYGLNYGRMLKVAPWKYFTQRLYNVDTTFASSTSYLFAALYYNERHQLEQQIKISYLRGNVNNGVLTQMDDPLSILDPVPNSPRYCQKKRYEMMAKLENLGPFQFFWTLSCGELRNLETFASIFALQGRTVAYENKNGHESIFIDDEPLEAVLERASLHELAREHVVTITRNFNHRVQQMITNIICGTNNPMHSTYYTYRVEFQMRGAPHVHGVLWIDLDALEPTFPGIKDSMAALSEQKRLADDQCDILSHFVDTFTSCSLRNEQLAEKVREVQTHKHTKTCGKKGDGCRFGFPRFPSNRTIIAQPLPKDNYGSEEDYDSAIKCFQDILLSVTKILFQLKDEQLDTTSIDEVLLMAEVSPEDYYSALSYTRRGTVIVLKREVNEIYINNYNPQWLEAWNANMDIQVCLDYFGVITYITDYYTKDESGTMPFLIDALEECADRLPKEKARIIADTFLTHRMKSESEAIYCLDPAMHLTDSNIKTLFVDTNFPDKRRKMLRKVGDDTGAQEVDDNLDEDGRADLSRPNVVRIPGKDGIYINEARSIHDKYSNRPESLENICLAQFATMYETSPKGSDFMEELQENGNHSSDHVIASADDIQIHLPKVISVGKSQFMRVRGARAVLRQKKFNEEKQPHAFMYSELVLFHPWRDENELFSADFENCQSLYTKVQNEIQKVQTILYPHKNNVEQGRALVESLGDVHASHIGDQMDPEKEQATGDQIEEGEQIDEDYIPRNLDFLPEKMSEPQLCDSSSIYRRIDISNADEMRRDVQTLDSDQRQVFDRVLEYCRNTQKMTGQQLSKISAPLSIVTGGAGSGKSTLIKVMAKWAEATLRDDNNRHPDHPHVVIAAPTGTAAKNIGGLTIHSAFNMPFGNEFVSLSDEVCKQKRELLSELKLLIIDEFSMVKADMLYQLNLRLKEIKQNNLDMGGLCVVLLGDLLQLRPVKGRYIFQKPKSEKFASSFAIRSLWNQFEVYELRENHRQGSDGAYADVLNRIRFGIHTHEDLELVKSRNIRPVPVDGVHLFGTNAEVNQFNATRLADIDQQLHTITAINIHPTIKNYRPHVSQDGSVNDTPLLSELQIKKGARIIITYNVDLSDGIVNGSLGTVRDVIYQGSSEIAQTVLIEFDDPHTGVKARKAHNRFDDLTPITRISFQYTVGRKNVQNTTKVKVIQFPMKLAWGVTVHKFQGQTVVKPEKLVGHFEKIYSPAMAYVLLGRVQSLDQLYLSSFNEAKIKVSEEAKKESERLESIASITRQSPWANITDELKISHLNIRSLSKHVKDLENDPVMMMSDVICLSETWIFGDFQNDRIQLPGFTIVPNHQGRGKGTVLYHRSNLKVSDIIKINHTDCQMIKISINEQGLEIIVVYRSECYPVTNLGRELDKLINSARTTVVCGDFNLNALSNETGTIVQFLNRGFRQVIDIPTFIKGSLLDHVYTNTKPSYVNVHPIYYSDHDATCIIVPIRH